MYSSQSWARIITISNDMIASQQSVWWSTLPRCMHIAAYSGQVASESPAEEVCRIEYAAKLSTCARINGILIPSPLGQTAVRTPCSLNVLLILPYIGLDSSSPSPSISISTELRAQQDHDFFPRWIKSEETNPWTWFQTLYYCQASVCRCDDLQVPC